jgi:tetratricopeptide (TPR) repeat protein
MSPLVSPAEWAGEQRRWNDHYTAHLAAQLRQVAGHAAGSSPAELRPHFESFLTLLNATEHRAGLALTWLALVDRLHPHPLRWGQWIAWLPILQQAERQAGRLGLADRRAEYLAYLADLHLYSGGFETALAKARTAMELARQTGAAWPLCVAAAAAGGALRSTARYNEAQALVQEARAAAVAFDTAQDPARAATGLALLDMELMDLHRHFGRLKEALELGEAIIATLTATVGVDPHDLAKAHVRRATITWVSGQYRISAGGLQRAAELFRQAGDPLQATFAEGNLGLVYYSMSRYQPAEALILTAIRAAEEVNARYRLVSDLGDLSVVYIALGRMDLAYDYTSRMVELAGELGNTAELSRGRGNRGYALLGLDRYEEALADIEFSLDLYRRQGRQEGTLVTTIDMIMYLRGIGEEERAAQLAQETYEAAWQGNFPHLHIVTTRCLALFPPAERQQALLRRALVLAREHERPMDEAGCLFSLAAIEPDRKTRVELYRQGVELLVEMGCTGWLRGRSLANPPLLPMII